MIRNSVQTHILKTRAENNYLNYLVESLGQDLDFHDQHSGYASHNLHSFPAKFPPQLPRIFIDSLTQPGDLVLDPMCGSGTTMVEAFLAGRQAIGFDIDPLAVLLSHVKTMPLDIEEIITKGNLILEQAAYNARQKNTEIAEYLTRFDAKTQEFINYWFATETQIELAALISAIDKTALDSGFQAFFKLLFSSIIITKSGGVSLAFDLAHTRPHRAKIVLTESGKPIIGQENLNNTSRRVKLLTKTLRSPLEEFRKKLQSCTDNLIEYSQDMIAPAIQFGNAQHIPLASSTIDLIVTSPPYASNAIDYMRAHKFSLVWMGYPINILGGKRKKYIGGESTADIRYEGLPSQTTEIIRRITQQHQKKGQVVHRYYSEMTRVLHEMYRVLKPGKAAIVVIGISIIQDIDIEPVTCLSEIGQAIGFEIPRIGKRRLDRNRRMLPASARRNRESQIQQRMHEEYVMGFYKPSLFSK